METPVRHCHHHSHNYFDSIIQNCVTTLCWSHFIFWSVRALIARLKLSTDNEIKLYFMSRYLLEIYLRGRELSTISKPDSPPYVGDSNYVLKTSNPAVFPSITTFSYQCFRTWYDFFINIYPVNWSLLNDADLWIPRKKPFLSNKFVNQSYQHNWSDPIWDRREKRGR